MSSVAVTVENSNNVTLEVTPRATIELTIDRSAYGPAGPAGPNTIGGYGFNITALQNDDVLLFDGTDWVNTPKPLGDVVGPASSTNNAIARFSGTTGKLLKTGAATLTDDGALGSLDSVSFDTTPESIPTAEGSLYWDTADGNKTLNLIMAGGAVTQQIGEETYYRIKASSAITDGQVVMFTGTVGNSGALMGAPATGLTAATASYVMGVATEDIILNGWGYITHFGLVRNINTTGGAEAWVDGEILYYNPAVAGGLTKTLPNAPNAMVQVCAVVKAGSNGSLFIRPTYGGALGQYEGDIKITSIADNQILRYDSVSSVWQNEVLPTYLPIINHAGSTVNISVANGYLPVLNRSGSTVQITIA